jgi:hypothetical protein
MMTATVYRRSHSGQPVKNRAEIALVAEAHFLCDIRDRPVRAFQEHLRALHAAVIEIVPERPASHLSEEIHEIHFAQPTQSRRVRRLDRFSDLFTEKFKERVKTSQSMLLAAKKLNRPNVRGILVYQ